MKNTPIELFGWYGDVAILLAFGLLSFNVLPAQSPIYILLNMTGALGILTEAFSKKDYQPAVLNLFWFAIAIISLIRVFTV